eukprot:6235146-Prymnesium_polylepis.1
MCVGRGVARERGEPSVVQSARCSVVLEGKLGERIGAASRRECQSPHLCPRGYGRTALAVDLKCKGPRFDSRGAPEGFSRTGQGKLFGLS